MRGTIQNSAPQLLQPPGSYDEVILSREPGEMREKANHHRGLQEEGIVYRLRRQSISILLFLRLLGR